jgi:putative CocE/NonD family hydrolase
VTPGPALLALGLCLSSWLGAQGAGFIKDNYDKQETRIAMRDRVRLFTAIFTPRGGQGPYPVLLHRTCYGIGPYGPAAFPDELGPDPQLARDRFIFVYQDVRGKMMSEGVFQEMTPLTDGRGVDEATDAYDTIDWVLDHVASNGKVGAWGISYPGYYAACALVGAHPALLAVSPQAPMADLFAGDDDHHNGALFLAQTFQFDTVWGLDRPAPTAREPEPLMAFPPDAYRFFLDMGALPRADAGYFHGRSRVWTDEMTHGSRDAYWQARDLRPHLGAARPAVLVVGGWYDAEDLFGTLQVHQRLQAGGGRAPYLVMGPWIHGGWSGDEGARLGPVAFGSDTAAWFQAQVEAPFFEHFLKGAADPGLPGALVFETGSNRWRRFATWPPAQARPRALYLRESGRLDFTPPGAAGGTDRFLSDPAHPVPHTSRTESEVSPIFMVEDQRFAARRPDVLVYQTGPLTRPLTLAGPVQAHLQVSTTGTDADWVVKLIDVLPDGVQQLVRAEVMRGKFRDSLAAPVPFVPGQPTPVAFALDDICHQFRPGHRLMVQVQSSWFPLVDRNPQQFMDIYHARDEDFHPAQHQLYHTAGRPSYLVVPVLD